MPDQNQVRPTVPILYAGKWIAWNEEETKIIASAETFSEARQKAEAQGMRMSPLEYVPSGPFIGGGA